MTVYEYKVAPAPKRLKRVRGVSSTAELFAVTLAEAINVAARDGWEYVRAESLPAEQAGGWFRRGAEVIETVLIFRRPRETLGPRLAAARPEPEGEGARLGPVERPVERHPERPAERPLERTAERRAPERPSLAPLRREPRLGGEPSGAATPLRPGPRLGPADPS
jgi:hypothetical protein